MQDLVAQLAMMLGAGQQPQMSPFPAPNMSPVPPGFATNLPRPAGLPTVSASPIPPGALGPDRVGPPGASTSPISDPRAQPEPEAPTRPQVPQSMLGAFADMFAAGDDAPQAEAQGGIGGFMRDAAAGMTNVKSTAPPAAAFGAGFGGALSSRDSRVSAAQKAAEEREEKAYSRKKDAADYGFKFSDEERAAESHADSRRDARLKSAETAIDLQKKMLDMQSGSKEERELKGTIIDDVTNHISAWTKDQVRPPKLEDINAEANRKRIELEDYYGLKRNKPTPAPTQPAPGATPPAPGRKPDPAGAPSDVPVSAAPPVNGADGLETLTPEQAKAKPKGTQFRTIDGRIGTVR